MRALAVLLVAAVSLAARAPEDAVGKRMRQVARLEVTGKRVTTLAAGLAIKVDELSYVLTNGGDKPIKEFFGSLRIRTRSGHAFPVIGIDKAETVPPRGKLRWKTTYQIDEEAAGPKLGDVPLSELVFDWSPHRIEFADGSVLARPPAE